MATIKEIAKACGVSVATVSNILNKKPGASEATRNLVLKTAKEMNYMPNYVAKNLKARNTRSIGVIAEDMTIFSIPDIIDGITEYCEKVKCQITKYQMCMGCLACESVCRFNALSIRENKDGEIEYHISDEKCKRCGECVNHFTAGCYMRKVLAIKRQRTEDKE